MNAVVTIRCLLIAACTVVVSCVAGIALAQVPTQPLQPLDPNVADLSPLSTSFRESFSAELRSPLGFTKVYPTPDNSAQLMRSSGALYATFNYSAYQNGENGTQTLIPAGTVFHIGAPWEAPTSGAVSQRQSPDEVEPTTRLSTRLGGTMVALAQKPVPTGAVREDDADYRGWMYVPRPLSPSAPLKTPSISPDAGPLLHARTQTVTVANDEEYRLRRLGDLVKQAVDAERERSDAPAARVEEHASMAVRNEKE